MDILTFGDSWVYGIGLGYHKGQTKEKYFEIQKNQEDPKKKSFRSLIARKFGIGNTNFSNGGSSNQRQFRKASEYFITDNPINKDIIVLWGLTSVYRMEYFSTKQNMYIENLLTDHEDSITKLWTIKCFDETVETNRLFYQIQLWNAFFKMHNIKNYWFNVFNEHEFPGKVDNMMFNGRSLLSLMVDDHAPNDSYHKSDRKDVDRKITKALDRGLVNPYSLHPTEEAHIKFAGLFEEEINFA